MANPIVERTIARLRKAKPDDFAGLVAINYAGLIRCEIAPASIDRFGSILEGIAAEAENIGIQLVAGEAAAVFSCQGETIEFAVTEAVRRTKHIPTEQEKADVVAWQREVDRISLNNLEARLARPRIPEFNYYPTGQLTFELELGYFNGKRPRRLFRDAKIQRLEALAIDIAAGVETFAAAKKQDRFCREERALQEQQDQLRRRQMLRDRHINERRVHALDQILDEIAVLERLRSLVADMRAALPTVTNDRLATFVTFAEQRLASREMAISTTGLSRLFDEQQLFGDNDDYNFEASRYSG